MDPGVVLFFCVIAVAAGVFLGIAYRDLRRPAKPPAPPPLRNPMDIFELTRRSTKALERIADALEAATRESGREPGPR